MKPDRTTKILLGIIAALVWISIQLTPATRATDPVQAVNIERIGGKIVFEALPVEIIK